jgi:hypothetical protein
MVTVGGAAYRHRVGYTAAPRWPHWMLGAMATFGALSLAQGFVDVVIPALTGAEPFRFLMGWTDRLGYGFFAAYLFVHNFGLACVVPGFGFLASKYEAHTTNRERIGMILLGAVLVSLLVGLEYLLQAAWRFDLPFALTLFAVEALAVLLLAFPSARLMRGFVPTRTYSWALVTPFRRLRLPLVVCVVLLMATSLVETAVVFDL